MVEPGKNEPPPKPEQKLGWLDNLAKRSAGLPEHELRSRPSTSSDASLWALAGLGIQFAIVVAVFAYGGHWLDEHLGWSPWGVISLTLIALIGNLNLLIKQARKGDPDTQKGPQTPPPERRDNQ